MDLIDWPLARELGRRGLCRAASRTAGGGGAPYRPKSVTVRPQWRALFAYSSALRSANSSGAEEVEEPLWAGAARAHTDARFFRRLGARQSKRRLNQTLRRPNHVRTPPRMSRDGKLLGYMGAALGL